MRSEAGGDGSRSKRATCRECGARVVIVMEPSISSENSVDDSKIWKTPKSGCDDGAMELSLESLGRAAARLQHHPKALAKAAREAGVAVVVTLNGVDFYNRPDLDRLQQLSTKSAGEIQPPSAKE